MVEDMGKMRRQIKKFKDKKDKKIKKYIISKLSNPLKSRRILKPSKATLTIKNYQAPDILSDPNRFFKKEMEETKRSLFFE
jgi:hypothetical protein